MILPSSYFAWLEKRPWLLKAICHGDSSSEQRAELLSSKSEPCAGLCCSGLGTDTFAISLGTWYCISLRLNAALRASPVLSYDGGQATKLFCVLPCFVIFRLHSCVLGGPRDLPCRIHGDEGPGMRGKNVLVINLSFPFSHSGVPSLDKFTSTFLSCCMLQGLCELLH